MPGYIQQAIDATRWRTTRTVKNLGWLLRNWKDVGYLMVDPSPGSAALLTAVMQCGTRRYRAEFADTTVLRAWLARPVFLGLPVVWNGQLYRIGERAYYGLSPQSWERSRGGPPVGKCIDCGAKHYERCADYVLGKWIDGMPDTNDTNEKENV